MYFYVICKNTSEYFCQRAMNPLMPDVLFLKYLNRLWCARSHLVERFSEISERNDFSDIGYALITAAQQFELELTNQKLIYNCLQADHSFTTCQELIACLEQAFDDIIEFSGTIPHRNVAMLNYLHIVESTEQGAFLLLDIILREMNSNIVSGLLEKCRKQPDSGRTLTDLLVIRQLDSLYIKSQADTTAEANVTPS